MRLSALIIVISLFSQFLKPALVLGDYLIRYQEYVSLLCENRAQPELHCNGTCQIAKLLQSKEEPQAPSLPSFSYPQDWLHTSLALEVDLPRLPIFSFPFAYNESLRANPLNGPPAPPPQFFA